jgi:phosphopantetheinyl transferase (holo-ACP synthase)
MRTSPWALALTTPENCPPPADPCWADWLTPEEIAYSRGFQRAGEHLAARRAAKEAVARLLGWSAADTPWQEMAIQRRPGEPPTLALRGHAAARGTELSVPCPGISLTHARGRTAAFAWLPGGRS